MIIIFVIIIIWLVISIVIGGLIGADAARRRSHINRDATGRKEMKIDQSQSNGPSMSSSTLTVMAILHSATNLARVSINSALL